ncbi:hypothetical protein DF186_16710, partial [Enterococcus hirae]
HPLQTNNLHLTKINNFFQNLFLSNTKKLNIIIHQQTTKKIIITFQLNLQNNFNLHKTNTLIIKQNININIHIKNQTIIKQNLNAKYLNI